MLEDKLRLLISKIKQQSPITLVVAVSLCLVLLFGIILGTVLMVKSANAYVSLDGITFDKGVCSYFASSYKTEYIANLKRQGVNASDTAGFWARKTVVDGKEYTPLDTCPVVMGTKEAVEKFKEIYKSL